MANFSSHTDDGGKILKRANPKTIQDKLLVGYQGWFTCPGDGEPVGHGHHGWLHWFDKPIPDGGRPNTDVWPDVSTYSPSELYPVPGLQTKSGDPVFLFSSRSAKTVQRHFHWMAEHGVDGAFLQRFVGECDLETGHEGIRRIRDEVVDRVREAAEREGRVFAIMYDVTGVPTDRVQRVIERDWAHLVRVKGILDSPNYLKEKGRPVISIWGLGFSSATHTPGLLRSLAYFFRSTTPGGVYLFAGVPSQWRTSEGDADSNPDFVNAYLDNFDAISPWSVGRYRVEADLDDKAGSVGERMRLDAEFLKDWNEREGKPKNRAVDYVPVVLPGGSGFNLSQGKWGFNDMKRNGGRFLWKQIANANKLGVRTIYGAMWDEYDEGTAFMPIVEHKSKLPVSEKYQFLSLDADGYDVPADWYMRICGFAAEGLRGERKIHETFPIKELQDYWSSRPKYEQVSNKSADFVSGSSSGVASSDTEAASSSSAGPGTGGQTYEEWLAQQKDEKEEAPPPPYSLEAEEAAAAAASSPAPAPATHAVPTAPVASPNPVAAAAVSAHIGASSDTSSFTPQTLQNVNTATSTYPSQATDHGHPAQSHTYPQSGYNPSPHTINPTHTGPNNTPQPHVVGQDPMGSLANEFGRQSISGEIGGGRVSNAAQPPLHPTHPAAKLNNPGSPYPSAPSIVRPQSQQGYSAGGPGHAAHPGPRPSTAQPQRPQSQQGGGSSTGWSQPQSQWPPQDWNVNSTPSNPNAAGANLNRPHTFTASSYGSGGANIRPSATTAGNAGHPTTSQPASPLNQGSFPNHSPGPSSPYATAFPQASQPFPGGSGYPGHNPGAASAPYNSSYPPWSGGPGAGAPNSGTSSYPGQKPGSQQYNPVQGSQYPWGAPSTAHSTSGPMFPTVAPGSSPSTFPGIATPSNNPPSNMPSATPGGSTHMPNPATGYSGGQGGPQFPVGLSGDTSGASTNYFPGGVAGSSAYSGGSSYPGGPSYPLAHHPSGSGAPMPAPGPWMPTTGGSSRPSSSGHNKPGSSSSPPTIPPRPTMPSSSSSYASGSNATASSGPAFPSAVTSTMDLAAGAMDKIVGKKTRIQLTSQVESLATSGNKLFHKFTK